MVQLSAADGRQLRAYSLLQAAEGFVTQPSLRLDDAQSLGDGSGESFAMEDTRKLCRMRMVEDGCRKPGGGLENVLYEPARLTSVSTDLGASLRSSPVRIASPRSFCRRSLLYAQRNHPFALKSSARAIWKRCSSLSLMNVRCWRQCAGPATISVVPKGRSIQILSEPRMNSQDAIGMTSLRICRLVLQPRRAAPLCLSAASRDGIGVYKKLSPVRLALAASSSPDRSMMSRAPHGCSPARIRRRRVVLPSMLSAVHAD